MSDSYKTMINTKLGNSDTLVNDIVHQDNPNFTVVNPNVQNYTVEIPAGTVLADKYVVETPLSTNTGEANLYICSYRKRNYVAKVYRRQTAIKDDIVLALERITSSHVAKIYQTGLWNGAPFEILPYYKYGSLEGKSFSFDRIKDDIVPALNEGLHALHNKNIIHKDLKPSNIMLCDDQKSVAIIDFGISSIRDGGNTVVVTKTGMTPEYSAPETFRNLFLEESDYYSLGITLYELYCGHTPYSGASKELIEQYIAVQKIPFPNDFPEKLKQLIIGLTYNDITNRKDKDNPNRRWTYQEVKKWCNGEELPIPGGENYISTDISATMPSFTFQYKKYTKIGELAEALGYDWNNGKKRLYRSLLTDHFRVVDQEIASACMDAEDAVRIDRTRADIEFFKVIYQMHPKLKSFHWIDYHFSNMEELGTVILEGARVRDPEVMQMMHEFFINGLFSLREKYVHHENMKFYKALSAIESKYKISLQYNDERTQLEQIYIIGYIYSKKRELITSYGTFSDITSLIEYTKSIISKDPEKIDEISKELIVTQKMSQSQQNNRHMEIRDGVTPQFGGWLFIQGKGSVLD